MLELKTELSLIEHHSTEKRKCKKCEKVGEKTINSGSSHCKSQPLPEQDKAASNHLVLL